MTESDRHDDDQIDVEALPQEGNSNARIYPPADKDDGAERGDGDPQQPATGDAPAVREGEDQQARSE